MPDYSLEMRAGAAKGRMVVGVDEAGRGPWAGPVAAAAVHLELGALPKSLEERIDDCKKLGRVLRLELAQAIRECAVFSIAVAETAEIDRLNILQASLLAMRRAVDSLEILPDIALVDGNRAPDLTCPAVSVVHGDCLSLSIAAASILAKVERDRMMEDLAHAFPGYGWERNRGYGTAEHKAALTRLGPTVEHRKSFAPVRAVLSLTY